MAQETEKSFPFDAEETEKGFDKVYVADDFARYFRAFISSGIFMKDPTNLQVIANGDMTVTLKAGKMIIEGYRYDNSGDIIISIDPADGVLGRIDRISATWSKDDRDIHYTLQKGTPSYEPVAPECRRTEEYKDYVVADIYVAAGVIKIQQQNITDQRLNTEVCGLAVPFTEINTDNIFTQYQDAVNEFLKFADTCIEGTVVGQIEADLAKKLDKTGDSGDNVVEFTQTSSRQNIMTGDTHKTMFGKIKKWLADLAAAAFMQTITSYSDLMAGTAIADYLVNAKAVQDGFNTVNGKLFQGKTELLSASKDNLGTWKSYLVNDLSKYKIIQLQIRDDNYSEIVSNFVSLDDFKNCSNANRTFGAWAKGFGDFSMCALCYYIDNTHVGLFIATGITQIVLRGWY